MRTLFLDSALRLQIEREARIAYPRECCGLMEGVRNADTLRVVALHETRNVAVDANEFEIDSEDHFRILRAARKNARHIVGCYHSHPDGKVAPSARDRAGASEEGFVWLIASLTASALAELTAFVWHAGKFEALAIES